jgi:TonB family protein
VHKLRYIATVLAIPALMGFSQATKPRNSDRIICTPPPAHLRKMVKPHYPPDALKRQIKGPVVISAIISKEGVPTTLNVFSGDPELAKAALEAIRQWRYKPYKLNGEPVEVETTIQVHFHPGRN